MSRTILILVPVLLAALSCASVEGESDVGSTATSGELVEVAIDGPGMLLAREDHGIGGYDAYVLPPAVLDYRRGSAELSEDVEEAFKAQLEQTLLDAAAEVGIPISQIPGECVVLVGIGLVGVDVDTRGSRSDQTLGEMTLVMELRDSLTGETLLHQELVQRVEDDGSGAAPTDQVLRRFDEMTRNLDLPGTLNAVGVSRDPARPGCQGLIAERQRELDSAVSAR